MDVPIGNPNISKESYDDYVILHDNNTNSISYIKIYDLPLELRVFVVEQYYENSCKFFPYDFDTTIVPLIDEDLCFVMFLYKYENSYTELYARRNVNDIKNKIEEIKNTPLYTDWLERNKMKFQNYPESEEISKIKQQILSTMKSFIQHPTITDSVYCNNVNIVCEIIVPKYT